VRVTTAAGREVTGLRAKVRELLALLAVHPDGLSTDQISEALWPDAPPGRASARLSPILAQTRRLLRDAAHPNDDPHPNGDAAADTGGDPDGHRAAPVDLVPLTDGRYRLHPVLLDTDHRRFTAALTAAADARNTGRDAPGGGTAAYRAAMRAAARLYRGEPFDGADYGWAEPAREALRRQATDTLAALADSLAPDTRDHPDDPDARPASQPDRADADPAGALTALEHATEIDPYNEELYRRIMRLHAAAGRRDAIRRTLRLLEARLVDVDTDPDPATLTLAGDLLRPRPTRTVSGRAPRG
jgi:DNA-binding SARP family transcriptional activator